MTDDNFRQIFSPQNPSSDQMASWKLAVAKELASIEKQKRRILYVSWFQLAAAMFAGIVLGGALFGWRTDETQKSTEEIDHSATIEMIYTKS